MTAGVKGVFTDGDLRRWLVGGGKLETKVSEAMTKGGLTLNAESRAIEAKEVLMKRKITAAPVVDDAASCAAPSTCRISIRPGLSNPSVPDASPAGAGWRRPSPAPARTPPSCGYSAPARG
jgi:arabinose 5-phosphate isomerase